jgi:hypothetical protein
VKEKKNDSVVKNTTCMVSIYCKDHSNVEMFSYHDMMNSCKLDSVLPTATLFALCVFLLCVARHASHAYAALRMLLCCSRAARRGGQSITSPPTIHQLAQWHQGEQ